MGKHREVNCQEPFCSECWIVIRGNIKALMGVAEGLLKQAKLSSEHPIVPKASSTPEKPLIKKKG